MLLEVQAGTSTVASLGAYVLLFSVPAVSPLPLQQCQLSLLKLHLMNCHPHATSVCNFITLANDALDTILKTCGQLGTF